MKKSVAFLFAVLISTTATFGFVPWLQTLFQDDVNTSEGSFFLFHGLLWKKQRAGSCQ